MKTPKGLTTRPTTDRVRESLFSAIASITELRLGERTVLDAFAGSGALGLEALSRGARDAVFVEKDRAAFVALEANIATLGVDSRATVVPSDVFLLAGRGVARGPFSLILLDPPYTLDAVRVADMLRDLVRTAAVSPEALCTWEHATGSDAPWPEGFELLQRKKYGSTEIEFAIYRAEAGDQ